MDLFELLVALAVILFGMFGGGKKKKPTPTPERQRRRAPAPPREPPVSSRPAPTPARPPVARPSPMAEIPVVYSYDESPESDVVSLETLEGAGEASHARFHQRYSSPLAVAVSRSTSAIRPPGGVRAAIVWSEILGPPRGLT